MDYIHDDFNNILPYDKIESNIKHKYFSLSKYYFEFNKESYDTIFELFNVNNIEYVTFTDGNKIYNIEKYKILKYKNSYLELLISDNSNCVEKDNSNNIVLENNGDLELVFDIYNNGIEKYFDKITSDTYYKEIADFFGFIPSINYDFYLSQNTATCYIINKILTNLKIKPLIDQCKYEIHGEFIDHCLYLTPYNHINIKISNYNVNFATSLEKVSDKIKINEFTDHDNSKYFFDGIKLQKFKKDGINIILI